MHFDIKSGPSYALATAQLADGETVVAESSAMVSMSSNVQVTTTYKSGGKGGLLGGLERMLGGESFFQNHFTAQGGPAKVDLAPKMVGDIQVMELTGEKLYLQSSSFLASGPGIELNTKWGGAKTFLGGEGMFMLECSGTGPLAFNAFGAIRAVDVDGTFTVDTGHIVAFEEGLSFKNRKFGGWKTFLLSGEGLVCEFTGKGRLYLQTRNPKAFGQAVGAMLPPRKR
jgi:uncharacterized protein (TIGR00266 family)